LLQKTYNNGHPYQHPLTESGLRPNKRDAQQTLTEEENEMVQTMHGQPRTPKPPRVKHVWTQQEFFWGILTAVGIAACAFLISLIALAHSGGTSNETIRTQARVQMAKDLGFTYVEHGTKLVPLQDGTLDHFVTVTSKRNACVLAANQAVNFKLTELPLDQLLAACASIQ